MIKKLILYVFLVGFLLLTLEIISFGFFSIFHDRFTFLDVDLYRVGADYISQAEKKFDARLGWNNFYPTPHGERPMKRTYGTALMSTYGDSYTHCDEVEDDQTWQAFLAAETHSNIYNFGVGGFGTGQAYLRFRDEFPKNQTPVVALGLITENINRAVNVFRPYYYPETLLRLTKPRFMLRDGKLKLKENPVRSITELRRLMDDRFLRAIGSDDWWFNRDDYPIFGFPYITILTNKRIWSEAFFGKVVQPISDINPRPWEELWKKEEPRSLMFALFERFFEDARGLGAMPLLLILPQREEVLDRVRVGRLPDHLQTILAHCKAKTLDCIEFVSIFATHMEAEGPQTLDRLYLRAHISPYGNRLIAERILSWLREHGLDVEAQHSDH